MKMISTLAAAVTMFAASSIVPVGAVTPAPLDTGQMSPVENVQYACRQVCRGGACRERCIPGKWSPGGNFHPDPALGSPARREHLARQYNPRQYNRGRYYRDGYRSYGRY
jgi:hypothetical protein